ncbi:methyl-accepting chemotaxis protein [Romboutsia sp.]|uniref:methyl-accepting chemotaxis protein n=1 Tax=Romboutsia sp. TaxID=1965302 RepID=UPI003F31AEEC
MGKQKEKKNYNSIRKKVAVLNMFSIITSCVILGIAAIFLNYGVINNVLKSNITQTTLQASNNVTQKIKSYKEVVYQIGLITELSNPNIKIEEKEKVLQEQINLHGFVNGEILNINGDSYIDGKNYSDKDFFKEALAGKSYISDSNTEDEKNKINFKISAPVWENGKSGSKVVGVVCFTPNENFLNDIVKEIKISTNAYSYIINNKGTTIGYEDASLVGVENTIEESKTNKDKLSYAQADQNLINGKSGFETIKEDGKKYFLSYTPVKESNGWGIGIAAPKGDFYGSLYNSIGIIIVLSLFLFIMLSYIVIKNTKNMGRHLELCSEKIEKLSKGDLNSEDLIINRDDEIGLVADSTNKIVNDFREIIKSLIDVLSEISIGNLNIKLDNEKLDKLFVNDFKPILDSVNKIVDDLNETLLHINISGEEVANSSEQVSQGAQILSQGAIEQANAVEELSQTINEVSIKINQTAQNTIESKQISLQSSKATEIGKKQMEEMINAMNEISYASNEISKIIKNIDDIAFQTNILALNAAVEAARAGEAGRGFAVVADEVRNLASKSAISAKNTAALIKEALVAVNNGTEIVTQTSKSLDEIVQYVNTSTKIMENIANASEEQAQHITQINTGIEQISNVVQANSATSQESAAASEQLLSQAQILKEQLDKFKLKQKFIK